MVYWQKQQKHDEMAEAAHPMVDSASMRWMKASIWMPLSEVQSRRSPPCSFTKVSECRDHGCILQNSHVREHIPFAQQHHQSR